MVVNCHCFLAEYPITLRIQALHSMAGNENDKQANEQSEKQSARGGVVMCILYANLQCEIQLFCEVFGFNL